MLDHEAHLEAELLNAPRKLSNHLFHYTNAEAAIFGILRSGALRLSPFESTNDLWESRPLHPNLTAHHDDLDLEPGFELWDELDRSLRLHAKVACLTQDWDLPSSVLNPDALRGWNHLSIWAHYGAGHTGVCLRFDREKLIEAFTKASARDALLHFHGPVEYRSATFGAGPYGLDVGQIRQFGLDAVAISYAEAHRDQIFFRKHVDWSNESEYRLVLIDQSVLPVEFPIREAITGVFLGDAFPRGRIPALLAALEAYGSVDIFRLSYHNRHLGCYPFDHSEGPKAVAASSESFLRSRSLEERVAALKAAVLEAEQRREQAAAICSMQLQSLKKSIAEVGATAGSWPNVEVVVRQSIAAVPDNQRSRAPGVPGEQVNFEGGYMCIVENLPKHTYTLVVAGAVQMLDNDRVRLHAMVKTERWNPDGNDHMEHWRETVEVSLPEIAVAVDTVIRKLNTALETTRADFDEGRGL